MPDPTITIDQYTTLQLSEYKGTFSLVEGWINREGDFKPNWCDKEFGKKGEKVKKVVPLSVKCGDRESVLKLAEWILTIINQQDIDLPF